MFWEVLYMAWLYESQMNLAVYICHINAIYMCSYIAVRFDSFQRVWSCDPFGLSDF